MLHVCLGLNTPRNQPDPDLGRDRDAGKWWGGGAQYGEGGGEEELRVKTIKSDRKYFICLQFPKWKSRCMNIHHLLKGLKANAEWLDFNRDTPVYRSSTWFSVLCTAATLGSWSPLNFNSGQGEHAAQEGPVSLCSQSVGRAVSVWRAWPSREAITENMYLRVPATAVILHVSGMCVGRGGAQSNFKGNMLK